MFSNPYKYSLYKQLVKTNINNFFIHISTALITYNSF